VYRGTPEQATTANALLAENRPLRQDTRRPEGFTTYRPDLHFVSPPSRTISPAGICMRTSETVRRDDLLQRATLVLNRSWQPVHVTTVRRALCMVFRESARIVCPESLQTYSFDSWIEVPIANPNSAIRSPRVAIAPPEIILLTRYNRVPAHIAPFTRRNLFLRDDFTCQYCARRGPADRLSVDHVHPRSRGGSTSWENCVLACVRCNARKANLTPKEAGLRLLRRPTRPRWTPYLNLRPTQHMKSWSRFTQQSKRKAGSRP
jgi:5-methylcytosine-specific restriction endonuclease McrA